MPRSRIPVVSAGRAAAAVVTLALALAPVRGAFAQDTSAASKRPGVRIGLTYNPGARPGVAILPVAGLAGDSVRTIIERDLDYGDRVTIVGAGAAAAAVKSANPAAAPDYALLAKLGAAAVVRATLTPAGVHVALYDVGGRRVALVRDFALPAPALTADWRMTVHAISDVLEDAITGTRGVAATRMLFVRGGRVYLVDSDGANVQAVTNGGLALSPTWQPSGRSIAYSAFGPRGTEIVVRNLVTGSTRTLAATPGGLNITPVFTPDGSSLIYAHGEEAGTDLVAAPLDGGGARRITVGRGTDNVSPTVSPDGGRVAFTSGRPGHPEVYITDADGTNAELLTPYSFGDQSYRSNPDWSPDGRVVAFQAQLSGRFQVMTISLRDRSVKQLTTDGSNEDPSWAPDARHLVFSSTRGGVRQLYVMDAESGRTRQLTRGDAARLPAWSPSLSRAP
ncbi:MAG TPA: hypothetical protein VNS52_00435 [Gemmatimonadaceae bacterium]|nr:hypothetical protein [Gemmatimonadaceae bacterium]